MKLSHIAIAALGFAALSACGGGSQENASANESATVDANSGDLATATEMNMGGTGDDSNDTTTGAGTGSTGIGGTAGTGTTDMNQSPNSNAAQ
jgi:hypothetical protein